MQAAVTGIATIWVVIGVGWLIAHAGLVNTEGRKLMARLAFTVASPMLLFSLVSRASLDHVFSRSLVVSILALAVTGALYLGLSRFLPPRTLGGDVIGFLCAHYTNAANFGLPVALALLGDATWMAPILLVQVAIIQPTALAVLDVAAARASGTRLHPLRYVTLPFRNPITVGIVLGLVVNLLDASVPEVLTQSLNMVGAMAIPLMLLSFGVSLRLDPLPGAGAHRAELWLVAGLKLIAHPLAAFLIGRFAFGLSAPDLYAVTVLGALPTAQNVFIMATRYDQSEPLARDVVFWTTIGSVASLLVITALLG